MVYGIGCDIAQVSRFEKWVKNPDMLRRFFNERELLASPSAGVQRQCEYYAARFAAKEAFSKALGTGLCFPLTDVFVEKDAGGRPALGVEGRAAALLSARCGAECGVYVSLSHEKAYAVACVVIERGYYGKHERDQG